MFRDPPRIHVITRITSSSSNLSKHKSCPWLVDGKYIIAAVRKTLMYPIRMILLHEHAENE